MLSVHPLNQGDPAWHNTLVGNSTDPKKTCGNVGCVVTAMTMAANTLLGPFPGINRNLIPPDLRPGGVAGLTPKHYSPGSAALIMESAAAALGLKCLEKDRLRDLKRDQHGLPLLLNLVDDTLAKGGIAILRVDYDLSSPEANHTVACFAHDASGFVCIDPAGGVPIILDSSLWLQRTPKKTYAATGVSPVFRA